MSVPEATPTTPPAPAATASAPAIRRHPGAVIALTLCGVLAAVLILATLVAVLPAAVNSTAAKAGPQRVPLLFGLAHVTLPSDAVLLLLAILASATGTLVHVATSFTTHVGHGTFDPTWTSWYLLRFFIGAALASVFYFVVRGGLFNADQSNASVNAYGIAAVAGFVGLFSRQATEKLRELFDTLFSTDEKSGGTPPAGVNPKANGQPEIKASAARRPRRAKTTP